MFVPVFSNRITPRDVNVRSDQLVIVAVVPVQFQEIPPETDQWHRLKDWGVKMERSMPYCFCRCWKALMRFRSGLRIVLEKNEWACVNMAERAPQT
jgi:hypothetical protein